MKSLTKFAVKEGIHHVFCAPLQRERWKPWIKMSGTKQVNKRIL